MVQDWQAPAFQDALLEPSERRGLPWPILRSLFFARYWTPKLAVTVAVGGLIAALISGFSGLGPLWLGVTAGTILFVSTAILAGHAVLFMATMIRDEKATPIRSYQSMYARSLARRSRIEERSRGLRRRILIEILAAAGVIILGAMAFVLGWEGQSHEWTILAWGALGVSIPALVELALYSWKRQSAEQAMPQEDGNEDQSGGKA
jgi:hypothetical protein